MKIELNNDGIFIDGNELSFPTDLETLTKLFGEPTRNYYESNDWRIIWDDKGICTSGTSIADLKFVVHQEENLEHLPKHLFKGEIIVEGTPIQTISDRVVKVKKYQFQQARFMGDEAYPVYAYWLGKNYDYKEDVDASKYAFKKISGEPLVFKDFNFKLAIIQELMYEKKLLTPVFDVHEFTQLYKDRAIDVNREGTEPIPEVVQYFKDLEIDKELAGEVTSLYQDGGNDIYMNIAPLWGGDEDYFDIHSFEDVQLFPKLKEITLIGTAEAQVSAQELKDKGIEVDFL